MEINNLHLPRITSFSNYTRILKRLFLFPEHSSETGQVARLVSCYFCMTGQITDADIGGHLLLSRLCVTKRNQIQNLEMRVHFWILQFIIDQGMKAFKRLQKDSNAYIRVSWKTILCKRMRILLPPHFFPEILILRYEQGLAYFSSCSSCTVAAIRATCNIISLFLSC